LGGLGQPYPSSIETTPAKTVPPLRVLRDVIVSPIASKNCLNDNFSAT